jgi:ligand-binding SRPBCC domain-containing protein
MGQIIQFTTFGYNNSGWQKLVLLKKIVTDEQRFGPYALWHHKHFWRTENGTKMTDIVHYALPLGF